MFVVGVLCVWAVIAVISGILVYSLWGMFDGG